MQSLTIDTGVQEFCVNGRGVLRFNPADPNLYHRFFALGAQLDALDAQMEENASDYVRLGELEEQKNALQAQMDALYEEWEQLDSSLS